MSNKQPILPEDFTYGQSSSRVNEMLSRLAHHLEACDLDDFNIDYSVNQSYELNSRLVKVESVEFQDDFSVTIILYKDYKTTSVSCYGLNFSQWITSVASAIQYLKYIDKDQHTGLKHDYDYNQKIDEVHKFYPSSLSAGQIKDYVLQLEEEAMQPDQIVNSEGAYAQISYSLNGNINSKGLNIIVPQSYYSCGVTVVASKKNEGSPLEVDSSFTGSLQDNVFGDLSALAQLGSMRAIGRLDRRSIESGQYPVVFTPRVSGHIFRSFLRAISGHSQYKKSSFLLDAKGKQVFPSWLNIEHNPLMLDGHYSFPIDSDGLIACGRAIVTEGVINDYILSLYSARRLGLEVNHLGGGARNLTITANAENLEDIVQKFEKCIVVDEVMGTGINLINGDYSMGINGFYYESGQRQFTVKEAAIAGNLKKMLQSIIYHGRDYKHEHNIRSGALALEQLAVSCN